MLHTGDTAPDPPVLTTDGEPKPLSAFRKPPLTVYHFIRHLGWIFCREQLGELRKEKAEFDRRGATIVLVSLASPRATREFAAKLDLPFTCVSAADGAAHRAFGVRRGSFSEIIGLKVLVSAIRSFFAGHRGGRPQGDVRVLPGTFVVDADGRIVVAHYGANGADHMKAAATLAAIDALGRGKA